MQSKKSIIFLLATFILAGCTSPSTEKADKPVLNYNSISGREGSDGPILAVKIDDTSLARPQIGLDQADLVYIEQVEGGLTRLAAIFSSQIPAEIGPVRSARISDIDILSQFGKVIFAYSGAQRLMLPVIASANLWDYGAQHSSPTIFTRDQNRPAPYNMVLKANLLLDKAKLDGREISISKSPGWNFEQLGSVGLSHRGKAVDSVVVRWPANKYEANWSESEKRWLFNNAGVADISASGTQLGATTFVIQLVTITNSIYRSKDGGYTPFSQTVGSGTGYILRDGRSFKAYWNRPSPESGTTWTLADGSKIPFARGSVWVALTDREPEFTLAVQPNELSK